MVCIQLPNSKLVYTKLPDSRAFNPVRDRFWALKYPIPKIEYPDWAVEKKRMADYSGVTTKIAQGLGIPKSTISTWISKGLITNPDKLLPTCKEILDYYKARIDELENRQLLQEGDRLYQQKVRLATAQADKQEIELAIAKGELHNSQEMLKALYNTLGFFKSTLTSWRSRISPQLINQNNLADIEDILEVNINEALSELAKGLEEIENNALDSADRDIQDEYLPDIEEGF